jgi:hypothetical protein
MKATEAKFAHLNGPHPGISQVAADCRATIRAQIRVDAEADRTASLTPPQAAAVRAPIIRDAIRSIFGSRY